MEAGLPLKLVHMFQTAQSHIPENSNDQFLCWRASLTVLEKSMPFSPYFINCHPYPLIIIHNPVIIVSAGSFVH